MIVTTVDELCDLGHLHPGLVQAGRFLARADLCGLTEGRHTIDGDAVFALVSACIGKGRSSARLEAHQRYIDVQYCLTGADLIGYRPLAQCITVAGAYDETKDVAFFAGQPLEWISIEGSTCAVFFPDDAHAPLGGEGACKKIVVKIRV
jgi:YhcH/YjgK/YiaL family protein